MKISERIVLVEKKLEQVAPLDASWLNYPVQFQRHNGKTYNRVEKDGVNQWLEEKEASLVIKEEYTRCRLSGIVIFVPAKEKSLSQLKS